MAARREGRVVSFFDSAAALEWNGGTLDGLASYAAALDATVDLGLPSGTRWAKCDLGAASPSDKGLPFRWGSAEQSGRLAGCGGIDFCGVPRKYPKYNGDDHLTSLEYEDDPCAALNPYLRTPSVAHYLELMSYCKLMPADPADSNVFKFSAVRCVSRVNGASVVFPATGGYFPRGFDPRSVARWTSDLYESSLCGDAMYFWCRSVAAMLRNSPDTWLMMHTGREMDMAVRACMPPVCD